MSLAGDSPPSNPRPNEVRESTALPFDGADTMARPLSAAWISEDLLESTRRVWSRAYRRSVSEREAMVILMNTKRFAEVLLKVEGEYET